MATKLQITITREEENLLAQKAAILGYDVTKYIKFMLSKEAYEQSQLSGEFQKKVKKAMRDYEEGKYRVLSSKRSIKEYFDAL